MSMSKEELRMVKEAASRRIEAFTELLIIEEREGNKKKVKELRKEIKKLNKIINEVDRKLLKGMVIVGGMLGATGAVLAGVYAEQRLIIAQDIPHEHVIQTPQQLSDSKSNQQNLPLPSPEKFQPDDILKLPKRITENGMVFTK